MSYILYSLSFVNLICLHKIKDNNKYLLNSDEVILKYYKIYKQIIH